MSDELNRALYEDRRERLTVRDGQSRDEINDQLRRQWRGERVTADAEPTPRKTATNEQISAALRRLAKGG